MVTILLIRVLCTLCDREDTGSVMTVSTHTTTQYWRALRTLSQVQYVLSQTTVPPITYY